MARRWGSFTVGALLVGLARPTEAQPQRLTLPEPLAPEPTVVEERGPSPTYYRLPPPSVVMTARTMAGIGHRFTDRGGWPFVLSINVGAAWLRQRGSSLGIGIEGGYSFEAPGNHLAMLGVGPGLHGLGPALDDDDPSKYGALKLALIPHAVLGRGNGALTAGERTSFVASFWMFGLEIAHQVLFVGPARGNEVHILAGIAGLPGQDR